MNTETIITELRLYNRWRRGDEAITAPGPTALGKLLDAAAESLCSLIARNTTLRRERSEARAEVAQIKGALALGQENCDAEYEALREERDEAKADLARMEEYLRNSGRNADEAQDQIAERDASLTNLRARVAELVAALEAIANGDDAPDIDAVGEWAFGLHCGLEDRMIADRYEAADYGHAIGAKKVTEWATGVARAALARAESATPARHPDTELLDSFEAMHGSLGYCDADEAPASWCAYGYAGHPEGVGHTLREAIADAARKQGGGK